METPIAKLLTNILAIRWKVDWKERIDAQLVDFRCLCFPARCCRRFCVRCRL